MTLDELQKRLQTLLQRKQSLETEFNNLQTNLVMIQGNINELSFHIQQLANPPKSNDKNPAEELDNQELSDKEYIDREMQVM